ncbi:MAG: sensor histidine kinase [Candidatus Omnitrophica bacterium]|nr:sensor histidine kinase [Candidatus Omnitrophota bacterium]
MGQTGKIKTGIRRKVALIICLSIIICGIIGISIGYIFGTRLLLETIGTYNKCLAETLAAFVADGIGEEVEDIQSYATRPLWIDIVKSANLKYPEMVPASRDLYFADMDRKWASADNDSLLPKEYTGNRISLSMKDILKLRNNIVELFITDKFGGLVAASGKTTDFYQADEEWWQRSYDEGKGAVFVGGVEFDRSSGYWSITIAAPIRDESGGVIGICKNVISLTRLFKPLESINIGKTGHPVLLDREGRILFHHASSAIYDKAFEDGVVLPVSSGKDQFSIKSRVHPGKGLVITTFAQITSTYLTDNGITWTIFIEQDKAEIMAPLYRLTTLLVVIMAVLLIIMFPLGSSLGRIFSAPIHALHIATERVIEGDWDTKIEVKTGDEIEQFANTFQLMIEDIKSKRQELVVANAALQDISKNLETKVNDRTKELRDAQEATLNILEDITDVKNKLEEALKIRFMFTSTVSHELRTPLAAIKESLSIVLDGIAGGISDQQKEFLDMAKRNVDRLARLINDILDFHKLESGKMSLTMVLNDINKTVEEVASAMNPLIKSKGLSISMELAGNLPEIMFDKDKIVQVLTNIIDNAVKFTERGEITIRTKQGDNFIQVSVQDTGRGIKQENMSRLFMQFEQLQESGERKVGGTGLGMAISKEIISKHKGKIWAESEAGIGTTFNFILPVGERRR